MPSYRMPLGLLVAPPKMEGQEAAAAAAAEHDAALTSEAAKLVCDAEDEAVFAAITYVAPSMVPRSVIKAVAAYSSLAAAAAAAAADASASGGDVVMSGCCGAR
jgi:hypothetical protein